MEIARPQPIWKYRSNPPHVLNWDVPVRTAIHVLGGWYIGDGVMAHQYDWENLPYTSDYKGYEFDPDPDAMKRRNLLDAFVVYTRWGWQTAYAMQLDLLRIPDLDELTGYHFGYYFTTTDSYTGQNHEQIRKNKIVIPARETVKFLIGDESVRIFALDLEGKELPAIFEGPISRRDPNFKNARLI